MNWRPTYGDRNITLTILYSQYYYNPSGGDLPASG